MITYDVHISPQRAVSKKPATITEDTDCVNSGTLCRIPRCLLTDSFIGTELARLAIYVASAEGCAKKW